MAVVPPCFGTPDGFMVKTNKAAALKFITKEEDSAVQYSIKDSLGILDGNVTFYMLKNAPQTFLDVALEIYNFIKSYFHVVFSTDSYDDQSIKAHERRRRGASATLTIKGLLTRLSMEMNEFLCNDENKKQLCDVIKRVFESNRIADKIRGKEVILVVEGKASLITSDDGVTTSVKELPELTSTHDETDR